MQQDFVWHSVRMRAVTHVILTLTYLVALSLCTGQQYEATVTTIAFCPETPKCEVTEVGILKPYPLDCTKYTYCDGTESGLLRTCSNGMHFNQEILSCTNPEEANCLYCEEFIPTIGICTNIPTCRIIENGYTKPYPPDCSKYIYCNDKGDEEIRFCPPNEHYSTLISICTNPDTAKCQYCEYVPTTVGYCPDTPTCEVIDSGLTKPYPPSCNKYIYCDALGGEVISRCPVGLHYNQELGYCTTPEDARCSVCTTTSMLCPDTQFCSNATPGETEPYPPVCYKYVYCGVDNYIDIRDCPDAMHFSPEKLECMDPEQANCPFCEADWVTYPVCPEVPTCDGDVPGVTKPYPPDCSLYIYCAEAGEVVVSSCPMNMHYSEEFGHCMDQNEAKCPLCQEYMMTTTQMP